MYIFNSYIQKCSFFGICKHIHILDICGKMFEKMKPLCADPRSAVVERNLPQRGICQLCPGKSTTHKCGGIPSAI